MTDAKDKKKKKKKALVACKCGTLYGQMKNQLYAVHQRMSLLEPYLLHALSLLRDNITRAKMLARSFFHDEPCYTILLSMQLLFQIHQSSITRAA
jgi:hypothetical protein